MQFSTSNRPGHVSIITCPNHIYVESPLSTRAVGGVFGDLFVVHNSRVDLQVSYISQPSTVIHLIAHSQAYDVAHHTSISHEMSVSGQPRKQAPFSANMNMPVTFTTSLRVFAHV